MKKGRWHTCNEWLLGDTITEARLAGRGHLGHKMSTFARDEMPESSLVDHPPHYTQGKFEVIEVLEDWFLKDPLLWQVGKYIARSPHKGTELQDLEKAKWYLERKIAKLKEQQQQQQQQQLHSAPLTQPPS